MSVGTKFATGYKYFATKNEIKSSLKKELFAAKCCAECDIFFSTNMKSTENLNQWTNMATNDDESKLRL